MSQKPATISQKHHNRWSRRLALLSLVAVAVVIAYTQFADALTLESLAQRESQLRIFQKQHPVLVYGIAFLIYVAVTGLSLPVAVPLSLLYGWYFGLWRGVVLVSFASTTGATLAFLLCRYLFRDLVQQRFGDRLVRFHEAFKREGAFYLFTLRLISGVPFFVINAVMGLTPIRVRTFWWVSQVGMLAGTIVYIYAGSSVPDLATLAEKGIYAAFTPRQLSQVIVAFGLLGVFPLAARWTMKMLSAKRDTSRSAV